MAAGRGISALVIGRAISSHLEAVGVEFDPVVERAGLNGVDFDDPLVRISLEEESRLWQVAAELAQDPDIGLHFGRTAKADWGDVWTLLFACADTLGEGFATIARYIRYTLDEGSLTLTIEPAPPSFAYRRPARIAPSSRHHIESLFAALVRIIRTDFDDTWAPVEVRFQHSFSGDKSHHEEWFRAPVSFDHECSEFILRASDLELVRQNTIPEVRAVLERSAKSVLTALQPASGLIDEVRPRAMELLKSGDVTLASLARSMNLSPRSLQRRLREEGTSHRELVDELRCRMAERYLLDPGLSVNEVGFLLGFTAHNAFHRAFRRWRGMTPGDYRHNSAMQRDGS